MHSLEAQIKALRAEGLTYSQIAETVHASERTVLYWCNPKARERKRQEGIRARGRKREADPQAEAHRVEKETQQKAEAAQRRAEAKRLRHLARQARRHEQWNATKSVNRLRALKKSAATRRIDCELTVEAVDELLAHKTCQRTGIPFENRGLFALSLDRVDSSKGYVLGNVQAVCWIYNVAKNDGTDEDVLRMARGLVARNPEIEWE